MSIALLVKRRMAVAKGRALTWGGAGLTVAILGIGCETEPYEDYSCATCEIRLHMVAVLGAGLEKGNPTWSATVARDTIGRYWIAPTTDPGEITVLSSTGTYVATVGRRGDGPGEYHDILQVFNAGAGVMGVVENSRITLLDTAFQVTATIRVAGPIWRAAAGPRSTVLVAYHAAGAADYPLHMFSHHGRHLSEFGADVARPTNQWTDPREIAPAVGEAFWTARLNSYTLERYGYSGRSMTQWQRRVPWYRDFHDGAEHRTSRALLTALQERSPSQLWSLIYIRTPVTSGSSAVSLEETAITPDFHRLSAESDYIVELLDVKRNRAVAAGRGEVLRGFVDSDQIYGVREAQDGNYVIHVWRLLLLNPRGG